MGEVNAGMKMSLEGFVKGRDGNFALLYPAFNKLRSESEGTTISTGGCKPQPQAKAGGAQC